MSENGETCQSTLKMTSSNVLFCPQLDDIQYTVIEEERKPENIHIWEAEIREFRHFFSQKGYSERSAYRVIVVALQHKMRKLKASSSKMSVHRKPFIKNKERKEEI